MTNQRNPEKSAGFGRGLLQFESASSLEEIGETTVRTGISTGVGYPAEHVEADVENDGDGIDDDDANGSESSCDDASTGETGSDSGVRGRLLMILESSLRLHATGLALSVRGDSRRGVWS